MVFLTKIKRKYYWYLLVFLKAGILAGICASVLLFAGEVRAANVEFTLSAWVKANDSAASKAVAVKDNEIRLISGADARPACQIHNGTAWRAAATSSESLALNQWKFISCVYDGSVLKIYTDGQEKGSRSETNDINNTSNPMRIGSDAGGSYNDWQGFIDEVKIYPYARSADQVKADYAQGLAGMGGGSGASATFGGSSDKWMSDGLVGYWKFDESATTSGALDSSGNGNDGTYEGHASTTAGKFGNGGVFDGDNDDVQIPSISGDLGSSELTLSAWIKLGESTSPISYILHRTVTGGLTAWSFEWGNDESFKFSIPFVGNVYSDDAYTDTDSWHSLIGVFSGSYMRFYIDGELAADPVACSGTVRNQTSAFFNIGADYYNSYDFDGQIDEVRIYNRALSPDEVRRLYEWAPGPVAHWKFDEKSGATAYDSAASTSFSGGNHGSISGAAWTRGKYGGALNFDGDDYVLAADSGALTDLPERAFSVSLWADLDSPDLGVNEYLLTKAVNANNVGWVFWLSSLGWLRFDIERSVSDFKKVTSNYIVPLEKGVHLAVTYPGNFDATNTKIYINGLEASSYADNDSGAGSYQSDAGHDLRIARSNWNHYFPGLIDDVRIYNYALDQKQILSVMQGGEGGERGERAINSPVLDLSFDEGYGGTAHDASIHGNDGLLYPGTGGDNTSSSSMWSKNGKIKSAIEVDGVDDFVSLGDMDELEDLKQMSISAWVRPFDFINLDIIFSKYHVGDDSGFAMEVYDNGGSKIDEILIGITTTGFDFCTTITSPLAQDEWGLWTVVYDGNGSDNYEKINIYYNGKEQAIDCTGTILSSTPVNAYDVRIGASADNDREFNGLIDEVKIYNYALSEDEVKILYNQGQAAVIGGNRTETNVSTTTTGAATDYCVPGDTSQCDPPVLELKFDEKTGDMAYDTSGIGNDGLLGGGSQSYVPLWSRGKLGSALEYDGSDKVSISENDSVDTENFTVEAWIKTKELNGYQGIVDNKCPSIPGQCGAGHDGWALILDDSKPGIVIGNSSGYTGINFLDDINTGSWHHLSVAYDGTDTFCYLNGKLSKESTADYVYSANDIGTDIGYVNAGGTISGYFNGSIDDVRIYDYARTPAQIAWDYNGGKPIAHWRFDECQGGTIHDESGNSNHGTLQLGSSGVTATGTCASSSDSFWYNGRDGKTNSAGSFDGDSDWVDVGDLAVASSTSFSFWLKPDSLTESIMDFDGGTHIITVSGGTLSASGFANPVIYVDGEVSSEIDTAWHHVLIYSDYGIDANDVDIGRVSTNYYDGLIDEVKIWNYALTAEQVKTEYNGGAVRFGN